MEMKGELLSIVCKVTSSFVPTNTGAVHISLETPEHRILDLRSRAKSAICFSSSLYIVMQWAFMEMVVPLILHRGTE